MNCFPLNNVLSFVRGTPLRLMVVMSAWALQAYARDWPHFLGPEYNCRAASEDVVGLWPKDGFAQEWVFPKGKGWACPVVVGERVVLFHRIGSQEVLDCLDLNSGKPLWHRAYEAPYRDRYGTGDGPRNNPVVSGKFVYSFGITGLLHCLDLASGDVVWKRDLRSDYQMRENFFGPGGTPLVLGGRVIVPVGGANNECVVALECETGREVWVAKHEWGASYSSPIPVSVGKGASKRQAVLMFAGGQTRPPTGGLLCIDAGDGKVLGEVVHRARIAESVNAASPVLVGDEQVFTTEGYGIGGVLSELGADGSLKKLWSCPQLGSQFGTPIWKDGNILGFNGQNPRLAELVCVDAKTGAEKWRDDLGGRFGRGNLLNLDDAGVLALGESGEMVLFKVGSEKAEVLQRVTLFEAPETWTLPVLSRRHLLISQNEPSRDGAPARLICFRY